MTGNRFLGVKIQNKKTKCRVHSSTLGSSSSSTLSRARQVRGGDLLSTSAIAGVEGAAGATKTTAARVTHSSLSLSIDAQLLMPQTRI
jgi:hypothetical protein